MLELKDKSPIAQGGKRLCFFFPDDTNRIVKVLKPEATPEKQRALQPSMWKRMYPVAYFDEQREDWADYHRIARWAGPDFARHIPTCHGQVETDMGVGLVYTYVRNPDGTPGTNLTRLLASDPDGVSACLDELCDFVLDNRLLPRGFRPPNVIVTDETDGSRRAWLVDGFGSGGMAISDWRRRWSAGTSRRRVEQMKRQVAKWIKDPTQYGIDPPLPDR